MTKNLFLLLVVCTIWSCQHPEEKSLESILSTTDSGFQRVLNDPRHEVQIIYGRIRNSELTHEVYGDTSQYFYPASSVKMLAAFAAAERLSVLDMLMSASLKVDSSAYYPSEVYDSLFQGSILMNNLMKKIFTYSDNQAYNTLFRVLGKDYINELHHSLGIPTRVVHQLSEVGYSFTSQSNNISHGYELRESTGDSIDLGEVIYNFSDFQTFQSSLSPENQRKGRGYLDKNDSLILVPFDFTEKNYVPLFHLIGALERLARPDLFTKDERYGMSDTHRLELLDIMTLLPKDLPYPIDTLPDNYVKFFMFGDQDKVEIPDHIIIRNKVGWAYGYLTDVAYIKDNYSGVEFFLAATIHVNNNQIYNDGVYEYEVVGLPFLSELGRIIYQYELSLKN